MFLMFYLFLSLSVLLFAYLCYLLQKSLKFMFSMKFLSLSGYFWKMKMDFDFVTFGMALMLFMCFSYVYFYTGHYFSGDNAGNFLKMIMCLFVGVMGVLMCTGDLLFTLMLWEYLGVVSFFLMLFYASYLSLRSSVITLVSSRFGDVCLFLLMAFKVYVFKKMKIFMTLMFLLILFTKSASFPFTSWLLEAMRAPTPVSSLVHSSTLVAAGMWFVMRYDMLNFINKMFMYTVLLIMTMFMTGLCCFFFLDLKKMVALSTCNNMAWCVVYLVFGDLLLSLFQLISHGVSKCILFMLVGDVMSGSGGSQASNCVYSPLLYKKWGIFGLFSVVLGLSGIPFIGVFFTKHFLLTGFKSVMNLLLMMSILVCVFMSYFYSFRLCSVLVNMKSSISSGLLFFYKSGLMVYFWLMMNFFISFMLDEVKMLKEKISMLLIMFQLFSCLTAYYLYTNTTLSKWSSSLFGCDNLVEKSYLMFYNLLFLIKSSFYRWDNYSISVFKNMGYKNLKVYKKNFLNLTLLMLILFLTCWYMVY